MPGVIARGYFVPTMLSSTLSKGLSLLQALIADCGRSALSDVARQAGIPLATAHRLALTLEADGYLIRQRKGHFLAGPALLGLGATAGSFADRAAAQIRLPLSRLARSQRVLLHFGVLEEGMVTYLLKENGGGERLFTEERMQLEAYCSAIGKIVLAALPPERLENYLAAGPFVALTQRTLTDSAAIRAELDRVRASDLAFDRFEIRDDLFCMAIPVRNDLGAVIGGISASFIKRMPDSQELVRLRRAMRRIARSAATDIERK